MLDKDKDQIVNITDIDTLLICDCKNTRKFRTLHQSLSYKRLRRYLNFHVLKYSKIKKSCHTRNDELFYLKGWDLKNMLICCTMNQLIIICYNCKSYLISIKTLEQGLNQES